MDEYRKSIHMNLKQENVFHGVQLVALSCRKKTRSLLHHHHTFYIVFFLTCVVIGVEVVEATVFKFKRLHTITFFLHACQFSSGSNFRHYTNV